MTLAKNFEKTLPYVNRLDLLTEIFAQMVEVLTDKSESGPSVDAKLKRGANLLAAYCASEKEDKWEKTLVKACRKIRDYNMIYCHKDRAAILLNTIYAINNYIIKVTDKYLVDKLVKYAYAVTNLIFDIDIEDKQYTLDDLFALVDEYHKHNIIPKPLQYISVTLSKEDEICHNTFYKDLKNRISRKMNNMIFIMGEHGGGKSYTALHLAYELDPLFDIKKQLTFTPEEFVKACNRLKKEKEEYGRVGAVVIFDEFGVGADAADYNSEIMKLLNEYLQLFRYLRLTVIVTAHDPKDALPKSRKRFSHYINMIDQQVCEIFKIRKKYDVEKQETVIKVENYEYEDEMNKFILKEFKVPTVDKKIADLYEEIRDNKVTGEYLEKIEEEIQIYARHKKKSLNELVEEFIEEHKDNEEAWKKDGSLKISYLMKTFNLSYPRASILADLIKERIAHA